MIKKSKGRDDKTPKEKKREMEVEIEREEMAR